MRSYRVQVQMSPWRSSSITKKGCSVEEAEHLYTGKGRVRRIARENIDSARCTTQQSKHTSG